MDFGAIFFVFVAAIMVGVIMVILGARRPMAGGSPRLCRACGAEHPRFARYCRRCGREL